MVYTDGIHLIASTIQELQRFIATAKLPQQHLNSATYFPHYRITEDYLTTAIEAGAKEVTPERLLAIAKKVYRLS